MDEQYGVPVVEVECDEPEGKIVRKVYPLESTLENLYLFYDKAKEFPTIFGLEHNDIEEFSNIFLSHNPATGKIELNGTFYVVDGFVGVLYINDFDYAAKSATAHYTFFDKRQRGRLPLVKAMMKYAFEYYGFNRLTVELPNFVMATTRHFVTDLGFSLEGKRRKAWPYKGKLYDVNLYGLLREEIISGSQD
jgi:RimJ/RimL family protein N-acetyltransferase